MGTALDAALFTIDDAPGKSQRNLLHKSGVAVSGAVGGAFGLPALFVELPIATTIMLRSIADIARRHGESISDPSTKAACLTVFAMGGREASDDASESGYLAVRMLLAEQVTEASKFLAKSAGKESAPALARLISSIAQRFGIQITEKAAAQLVPVAGAIGGATVNLLCSCSTFRTWHKDISRCASWKESTAAISYGRNIEDYAVPRSRRKTVRRSPPIIAFLPIRFALRLAPHFGQPGASNASLPGSLDAIS